MTIHHATIKAAANKGVILSFDPGSTNVTAFHAERNKRVVLTTEEDDNVTDIAKDAWNAVMEMIGYEDEHTEISIQWEDGDFVAYKRGKRGQLGDVISRDPELSELLATLADTPQDEDESEASGSVVPETYKKMYAERGDATNCGDWLALLLNKLCKVTDGKTTRTDLDRLASIAGANGVEPGRYGKLGIATNGWQGRYRMTVRNMLTKTVAAKGFLFVPESCGVDADQEIKAPREWCVEHSPKPKVKAEPKAAVAKNEGAGKASAKTRAEKGDGEAGLKVAREALASVKAKEAAKRK